MEDREIQKNTLTRLDLWARRVWPYILAGIAIVLLALYLLIRMAVANGSNTTTNASSQSSTTTTTSTAAVDITARHLDGIKVDPQSVALQPYAVMVETFKDARPMSGTAKANLVIEAPVEGGITRLMAVFDASTTVEKIGPVRSARPYFVELAKALNAVYAHVGGSPDALNRIAGLGDFRNLDEMANGSYFWRDTDRSAPHNVYIKTEFLLKALASKKWKTGTVASWVYEESSTGTKPGDVLKIAIPYGGDYTVNWTFDPLNDAYLRNMGGKQHFDSDGTRVMSTNVLVLLTDQRVLDDVGRLSVRTAGTGKAILYNHGFAQEAQWVRDSGSFYRIQTPDGRPVVFARGTTWIEIVTSANMMPSVKPTL